jgi:hypothetical protein
MLHVNIDAENNLVVLEPKGALRKEDFDNAVELIDPFIEQNGKLNGIVIYTESFPGWEDFAALNRHMVFIRNHHQKIKRLAFVTDSNVMDYAKAIATPFVSAKIEVFPFAQLKEAKAWVLAARAE